MDINKDEIFKNEIVIHVDQLLQLNEEILVVTLESKRQQILGKIDYCERRINKIAYQLYGLTDGEIKIVEGKADD